MSGFDQPYWNSLQLLAWVYLDDRTVVDRCDDRGPSSETHWHSRKAHVMTDSGKPESTWIEEPRGKPSSLTIELYASASLSKRYPTMAVTEEEIATKLLDADIAFSATGIRNGQRQQISTTEWLDLKLDPDKNAAVHRPNHQPKYSDLRFWRADILRLWPAVPQPAQCENDASNDDEANEPSSSPKAHAQNIDDGASSTRQRGVYKTYLEHYLAEQDLGRLKKLTPRTIAKDFCAHCEEVRPEIFNDPSFPKNLRPMIKMITDHIEKRDERVKELAALKKKNNDVLTTDKDKQRPIKTK
jgi:hypothetical protein